MSSSPGLEQATTPERATARRELIGVLRRAHAGERAAWHAYEGHWRSVWNAEQRAQIQRIAEEEAEHRRDVGVMLSELGSGPAAWRERVFLLIGVTIHVLCRLGGWTGPVGWFVSMYGAGKLESKNVEEYVVAAEHARDAGLPHLIAPLLHMAYVEWEHERAFWDHCAAHPLRHLVPPWVRPAEPPREL